MEETQALGGEHGPIHRHPGRTLVRHDLRPEEGVCYHCQVVGRPAEEEGHHHEHYHLHSSLPLEAAAHMEEALDGNPVTGQHDGQGDKKTQGVAKNPGHQTPRVCAAGVILLGTHNLAGVVGNEGGTEKPRQRQQRSDQPHGDADAPADHLTVGPTHLHSSHNHHVAVHADASQEEDAGVEAQLLDDGDNFAHGIPKHPALCHGGGPEWQRDGQQEVRGRQVEEVEVRGRKGLLAQADHQPHHQVSRNGQKKDEDVESTDCDHSGVRDGEGATWLRVWVQVEIRVVVGKVEFFIHGAKVDDKRRRAWN